MFQGDIVDKPAGFKIIETIQNDIRPADQSLDIFIIHIRDDALDLNGGIDLSQMALRGNGLGQLVLNVVFIKQGLPGQVVILQEISVDDPDLAHAGADYDRSNDRTEGPATNDDGTTLPQFLLPFFSNAVEKKLS